MEYVIRDFHNSFHGIKLGIHVQPMEEFWLNQGALVRMIS